MTDTLEIPTFLRVERRASLVVDTARDRMRQELARDHATVGELRATMAGILQWLDDEAAQAARQTEIVERAKPIAPVDLPPHPGVARFNSPARTDYGRGT